MASPVEASPGDLAVPVGWVPIGGRGPLSVSGSWWSWSGYLQLGPILTSAPVSTWLR
uniref:SEBOX homeobox n=1 Tax=Mus musculus TaxID=10090 RepID=E9Q4C2_MOUSE